MVDKAAIDKTIALIRATKPEYFNMGSFISGDIEYAPGERTASEAPHWCGTTLCLAGFAVAANLPYTLIENIDQARGMRALGITEDQAEDLFVPGYIGTEDDSPTPICETDPERGIKVLEHLRDTGKVDWSVAYPEYSGPLHDV